MPCLWKRPDLCESTQLCCMACSARLDADTVAPSASAFISLVIRLREFARKYLSGVPQSSRRGAPR